MADSSTGEDLRHKTQQSPLASRRTPPSRPDGNPPADSKKQWFPLGYKEGWSQWWSAISPADAEHKVLSFIPFLKQAPTQTQTATVASSNAAANDDTSKTVDLTRETSKDEDPYGPRIWHSALLKLSGKNRALNEFSVERTGETVENNMVMIHGYGAGLGFFYKNFEPLSRLTGWRLYSLDLLGMGRSSRPPFKINAKDREGKTAEAENWFVDSLEEWRKERKIERFTLLGHSLGGYMAVCYALKYPGRLNKLILASPVGIPLDPYAVNADMPEPEESTVVSEISADQGATTGKAGDKNNFLNARSKAEAEGAKEPKQRPMPKWLTYLWDANVSPFSLVRLTGPLGPRLVSGWTSRRFSQMPGEEAQALHDYAYSLFRQRGSGEYALTYILAPGAYARSPLIRRMHGVGRQTITKEDGTQQKEQGIPIVLMYGDHDWMDVSGGYDSVEILEKQKKLALEQLKKEDKVAEMEREQGESKVLVVSNAGHHVYLDNHQQFNEMITKEMKDVEKREKQRKSWLGLSS